MKSTNYILSETNLQLNMDIVIPENIIKTNLGYKMIFWSLSK